MVRELDNLVKSLENGSTNKLYGLDWDISNIEEIESRNTVNGPIETVKTKTECLVSGIYGMMISLVRYTKLERITGFERKITGPEYFVELYHNGIMIRKIESEHIKEIYQTIDMNMAIKSAKQNSKKYNNMG